MGAGKEGQEKDRPRMTTAPGKRRQKREGFFSYKKSPSQDTTGRGNMDRRAAAPDQDSGNRDRLTQA